MTRTITESRIRSASNIAIRWSGACRLGGSDAVEVVVAMNADNGGPVEMESWMTCGGARRPVLDRCVVRCDVCVDDDLLHVDVYRGGDRLLAATIDAGSGRLIYARTPLLARAGLPAGAFDPPTAERVEPGRGVATA